MKGSLGYCILSGVICPAVGDGIKHRLGQSGAVEEKTDRTGGNLMVPLEQCSQACCRFVTDHWFYFVEFGFQVRIYIKGCCHRLCQTL